MKIPKRFKKISHRSYLFGDIDKDGVKNVDDYKPYDKNVSEFPSHKENPEYYRKARLGGGEVKLSSELMAIERYNNKRAPILNKFLGNTPGAFGRIKTVPSTLRKLRKFKSPLPNPEDKKQKKYATLTQIDDVAAATILTNTRQEAYSKGNFVKDRFPTDEKKFDDFFEKPKKSHRALHYTLVSGSYGRKKLEVQVKTKKGLYVDILAHPYYKAGKTIPYQIKDLSRFYHNAGY